MKNWRCIVRRRSSWLFVQIFTSQFRVYMLATFAGKSGPVSIPGCTVRSGIRMSSRSQSSNILLKINWERCSRSPRSLKGNGWIFGSRLTQTEFLTQIGEIILGHDREEDKYCRISSEQKEKQVRRRYFSWNMEELISTIYLYLQVQGYRPIRLQPSASESRLQDRWGHGPKVNCE